MNFEACYLSIFYILNCIFLKNPRNYFLRSPQLVSVRCVMYDARNVCNVFSNTVMINNLAPCVAHMTHRFDNIIYYTELFLIFVDIARFHNGHRIYLIFSNHTSETNYFNAEFVSEDIWNKGRNGLYFFIRMLILKT
jgi:hypothetical protein